MAGGGAVGNNGVWRRSGYCTDRKGANDETNTTRHPYNLAHNNNTLHYYIRKLLQKVYQLYDTEKQSITELTITNLLLL